MYRWRARLKRWHALSSWERRALCSAWLLLPCVSLSLRWLGFRTTTALLTKARGAHASGSAAPHDCAASLARLLTFAADHTPGRPACLARSVTLWFLLARRGVAARVKIGVRNTGSFSAHAWVEIDGRVFLDAPDVAERFAVIV
jgi:hypothetical protein